ncbi:TIGR00180 family glycosyltransferase, partial [bacterium]
MSKSISIIIPTHERDHLLERALAYYSNFEIANIIICDSSLKPSLNKISKEITYFHLPGYSFAAKLLYVIERVSSPYACLSADDDFLVESSLIQAADFLRQNSDHIAVTGYYIHFILQDNQEIVFNPLYEGLSTKHREHQDARERVVNSLNSSVPLILGLFRTEILKNSIRAAAPTTKISNVEIACNIVPMIYGKSKKLPVFWMARDVKRYTCYNISGNDINSVINDYSKYLSTDDGVGFRKIIADLIAEILDIELNDSFILFD